MNRIARGRLKSSVSTAFATGALVAVALWGAGLSDRTLLSKTKSLDHAPAVARAAEYQLSEARHAAADPSDRHPGKPHGLLRMRLLKSAPGRNPYEGTAQIAVGTGNARTYQSGAMLANGMRVAELYGDRVILKNEQERTLLRVEQPLDLPSETAALLTVAPRSDEALTDVIRPTPVYQHDSVMGYEVYPGKYVRAFEQLGLRPGDVILAVNDERLQGHAAIELLRHLIDGTAATATVRRQGRSFALAIGSGVTGGAREDAANSATATDRPGGR